MNAFTPLDTEMPATLAKPFDPENLTVDLEAHFYPEVRAYFDDAATGYDAGAGEYSGEIRGPLLAISLNGAQFSREQAVAILTEAHVRQIEELHKEGAL